MKKIDTKRIIGIILCTLLVGALSFKFYLDSKDDKSNNNKVATVDSKKFKEEYESLNNTKNSSGRDILNLSINEANPIVYKTAEEITDILKNKTGIVYFGFNSCPWCRSMIETLIKSAEDNNIDTIYYVDIKDIRSSFEVKNNKLVEIKKGSTGYYQILDILAEYLQDYKITNNKKEYDTKEKRLYAPTVVMVKDGEIKGFHEDTVPTQEDPYLGLNAKEKQSKIFNNMISEIKSSTCTEQRGC